MTDTAVDENKQYISAVEKTVPCEPVMKIDSEAINIQELQMEHLDSKQSVIDSEWNKLDEPIETVTLVMQTEKIVSTKLKQQAEEDFYPSAQPDVQLEEHILSIEENTEVTDIAEPTYDKTTEEITSLAVQEEPQLEQADVVEDAQRQDAEMPMEDSQMAEKIVAEPESLLKAEEQEPIFVPEAVEAVDKAPVELPEQEMETTEPLQLEIRQTIDIHEEEVEQKIPEPEQSADEILSVQPQDDTVKHEEAGEEKVPVSEETAQEEDVETSVVVTRKVLLVTKTEVTVQDETEQLQQQAFAEETPSVEVQETLEDVVAGDVKPEKTEDVLDVITAPSTQVEVDLLITEPQPSPEKLPTPEAQEETVEPLTDTHGKPLQAKELVEFTLEEAEVKDVITVTDIGREETEPDELQPEEKVEEEMRHETAEEPLDISKDDIVTEVTETTSTIVTETEVQVVTVMKDDVESYKPVSEEAAEELYSEESAQLELERVVETAKEPLPLTEEVVPSEIQSTEAAPVMEPDMITDDVSAVQAPEKAEDMVPKEITEQPPEEQKLITVDEADILQVTAIDEVAMSAFEHEHIAEEITLADDEETEDTHVAETEAVTDFAKEDAEPGVLQAEESVEEEVPDETAEEPLHISEDEMATEVIETTSTIVTRTEVRVVTVTKDDVESYKPMSEEAVEEFQLKESAELELERPKETAEEPTAEEVLPSEIESLEDAPVMETEDMPPHILQPEVSTEEVSAVETREEPEEIVQKPFVEQPAEEPADIDEEMEIVEAVEEISLIETEDKALQADKTVTVTAVEDVRDDTVIIETETEPVAEVEELAEQQKPEPLEVVEVSPVEADHHETETDELVTSQETEVTPGHRELQIEQTATVGGTEVSPPPKKEKDTTYQVETREYAEETVLAETARESSEPKEAAEERPQEADYVPEDMPVGETEAVTDIAVEEAKPDELQAEEQTKEEMPCETLEESLHISEDDIMTEVIATTSTIVTETEVRVVTVTKDDVESYKPVSEEAVDELCSQESAQFEMERLGKGAEELPAEIEATESAMMVETEDMPPLKLKPEITTEDVKTGEEPDEFIQEPLAEQPPEDQELTAVTEAGIKHVAVSKDVGTLVAETESVTELLKEEIKADERQAEEIVDEEVQHETVAEPAHISEDEMISEARETARMTVTETEVLVATVTGDAKLYKPVSEEAAEVATVEPVETVDEQLAPCEDKAVSEQVEVKDSTTVVLAVEDKDETPHEEEEAFTETQSVDTRLEEVQPLVRSTSEEVQETTVIEATKLISPSPAVEEPLDIEAEHSETLLVTTETEEEKQAVVDVQPDETRLETVKPAEEEMEESVATAVTSVAEEKVSETLGETTVKCITQEVDLLKPESFETSDLVSQEDVTQPRETDVKETEPELETADDVAITATGDRKVEDISVAEAEADSAMEAASVEKEDHETVTPSAVDVSEPDKEEVLLGPTKAEIEETEIQPSLVGKDITVDVNLLQFEQTAAAATTTVDEAETEDNVQCVDERETKAQNIESTDDQLVAEETKSLEELKDVEPCDAGESLMEFEEAKTEVGETVSQKSDETVPTIVMEEKVETVIEGKMEFTMESTEEQTEETPELTETIVDEVQSKVTELQERDESQAAPTVTQDISAEREITEATRLSEQELEMGVSADEETVALTPRTERLEVQDSGSATEAEVEPEYSAAEKIQLDEPHDETDEMWTQSTIAHKITTRKIRIEKQEELTDTFSEDAEPLVLQVPEAESSLSEEVQDDSVKAVAGDQISDEELESDFELLLEEQRIKYDVSTTEAHDPFLELLPEDTGKEGTVGDGDLIEPTSEETGLLEAEGANVSQAAEIEKQEYEVHEEKLIVSSEEKEAVEVYADKDITLVHEGTLPAEGEIPADFKSDTVTDEVAAETREIPAKTASEEIDGDLRAVSSCIVEEMVQKVLQQTLVDDTSLVYPQMSSSETETLADTEVTETKGLTETVVEESVLRDHEMEVEKEEKFDAEVGTMAADELDTSEEMVENDYTSDASIVVQMQMEEAQLLPTEAESGSAELDVTALEPDKAVEPSGTDLLETVPSVVSHDKGLSDETAEGVKLPGVEPSLQESEDKDDDSLKAADEAEVTATSTTDNKSDVIQEVAANIVSTVIKTAEEKSSCEDVEAQKSREASVPQTLEGGRSTVVQVVRTVRSDGEIVEHVVSVDSEAALEALGALPSPQTSLGGESGEELEPGATAAAVVVYADTVEERPDSETEMTEYEEILPDGTLVRRKVVRTTRHEAVTRRVVVDQPPATTLHGQDSVFLRYSDRAEEGPVTVSVSDETVRDTLADGRSVVTHSTVTSQQTLVMQRTFVDVDDRTDDADLKTLDNLLASAEQSGNLSADFL